jgi:general secretion pathway protein L
MRQMLPFALEDQFADDVASLHFAAGTRANDGHIDVSVVARDRLDAWLERITAAELEPAAICADTDGVADTPSTLNVICENGAIFARRPGEAALSMEGIELSDAIDIVAHDAAESGAVNHILLCVNAASREANAATIESLSRRFASLDVKLLQDDALSLFAAKLINHPGPNLLQGSYAPKSDWDAMLRPWRIAGVLAAGLAATAALATIVDYVDLRRTDAALTSALEARCSADFRAAGLRQCEAEVQARLRDAGVATGGSEEFLTTLAGVAAVAGAENMLRSVSYRNSVMDMQLVTPSVPALDEFSRRLGESGPYTVAVQSTNPQEDGTVESRLQIVGENR